MEIPTLTRSRSFSFRIGLLILGVWAAPVAVAIAQTGRETSKSTQKTGQSAATGGTSAVAEVSRQERLRIRGMPTTPVILITWKAIQDELGLTEDQRDRIQFLHEEFTSKRLDLAKGQARREDRLSPSALMARIAAIRTEHEAALARALSPRQRTRLEQVALQIEGPLAVSRPEIADRINLSPEQLELVQEVVAQMKTAQDRQWADRIDNAEAPSRVPSRTDARGAASKSADTARPDPIDLAHEEQISTQDTAVREVAKILTRRQRAAFNRLLGKPFDLTRLRPGSGANSLQPPRSMPPADDAPSDLQPIDGATSKPGSI
jgi:hypothetical protein